jgi:hypothetical protein
MRTDPYGDPEDYESDRPAWVREPSVVVFIVLGILAVGLLGLAVVMAFRVLGRVGG